MLGTLRAEGREQRTAVNPEPKPYTLHPKS